MSFVLPNIPFQSATPNHIMFAHLNSKQPTNSPQGHETTTNILSTKSDFVEGLVDTALLVVQSIWGDDLPGTGSAENTRGLPLRVFIRETLRRSRTSYSTLQIALFYLFRVKALRDSQAQKSESTATGIQTKSINTTKRTLSTKNNNNPPTLPSPSFPPSPCSLPSSSPITCQPSPEPERPTKRIRQEQSPKSSEDQPMPFTANSTRRDDLTQCGRRMFLASLISAAKYLQDRNYSNRAWSKISGLSVEEINRNEMSFLRLIDYRLFVSPPLFRRWSSLLLGHVNSLQKTSSTEGCLATGTCFSQRPSVAVA